MLRRSLDDIRLALYAMCLTVILSSPAQATDLSAGLLAQPKVFWREFMKDFYGSYSRQMKCWISVRAGQRYCMRPHRLDEVRVGKQRYVFLVVGGSRMDDNGVLEQYHAAAGAMGLIVLKEVEGQLQTVAKNSLYEDFGSFGQLPSEDLFEVRQIGPNDTYGWTATGGWSGMGITIESTTIYAPIGDKVVSIGTMPNHYDDEGNCDGGKNLQSGAPCTDYSFELMFDPQDQSQRFYPIVLKLSGSRQGVLYDQSFTVPFDPQKYRYRDIKDLPQGIDDDG